MKDVSPYADDFGPFDGHVWLNSASEGPLPHQAVTALKTAIEWKTAPHKLTIEKFSEVPRRVKAMAAPLLGVPAADVILANSASYGIHLLANGLSFQAGDEILLMQDDFPVDILPWLAWEAKGVNVRQEAPVEHVFSPEDVERLLTPQTRLLCLSHVHTFTGRRIDPVAIGEICGRNNVLFVLNVSQSAGNEPLGLADWPVDAAVTSGFKWLCGPYGTGLCWIRPELREKLTNNHVFWANTLGEKDLQGHGPLAVDLRPTARHFDVFGTANFFNFVPLATSLEYLNRAGLDAICRHIQQLTQLLVDGLEKTGFRLISSSDPAERTALTVFSHRDPGRNPGIHKALTNAGIHLALWKGNLRAAPHIFNGPKDINWLLESLANS